MPCTSSFLLSSERASTVPTSKHTIKIWGLRRSRRWPSHLPGELLLRYCLTIPLKCTGAPSYMFLLTLRRGSSRSVSVTNCRYESPISLFGNICGPMTVSNNSCPNIYMKSILIVETYTSMRIFIRPNMSIVYIYKLSVCTKKCFISKQDILKKILAICAASDKNFPLL